MLLSFSPPAVGVRGEAVYALIENEQAGYPADGKRASVACETSFLVDGTVDELTPLNGPSNPGPVTAAVNEIDISYTQSISIGLCVDATQQYFPPSPNSSDTAVAPGVCA